MPNNRNENVELRLDTNTLRPLSGAGRKLFVETYGCQMNVGDTEIVVSVMQREGYVYTERIDEADVILINTCSIRDNAEQRIWGRLAEMKRYRRANPGLVVGVIGCMAERLKEKLVEGPHGVDVVAIITFILVQFNGIKKNGVKHFTALFQPLPFLFPINLIGEFAVPLSLSLRLFGNVMSGTVLMGLIYDLVNPYTLGYPALLHAYFDLFSGCIQAYVFSMLTMVYVNDKIAED